MGTKLEDEAFDECYPVFCDSDRAGFDEAVEAFDRAKTLEEQYDAAVDMDNYLESAHDNAERLVVILKEARQTTAGPILAELEKAVRVAERKMLKVETSAISIDDQEKMSKILMACAGMLLQRRSKE